MENWRRQIKNQNPHLHAIFHHTSRIPNAEAIKTPTGLPILPFKTIACNKLSWSRATPRWRSCIDYLVGLLFFFLNHICTECQQSSQFLRAQSFWIGCWSVSLNNQYSTHLPRLWSVYTNTEPLASFGLSLTTEVITTSPTCPPPAAITHSAHALLCERKLIPDTCQQ